MKESAHTFMFHVARSNVSRKLFPTIILHFNVSKFYMGLRHSIRLKIAGLVRGLKNY